MQQKPVSIPRYFGLPNSAAKAYFVAQKLPVSTATLLFITAQDTDDFNHAALEFAPQNTKIIHFPDMDTGRINALYTLLTCPAERRIISVSYEALATPLPDVDEFKAKIFTLHTGNAVVSYSKN